MGKRPAVERAYAIGKDIAATPGQISDEAKAVLYGQTREEAEEVLRVIKKRKLWVLSPYRSRGMEEAVRRHLQDM